MSDKKTFRKATKTAKPTARPAAKRAVKKAGGQPGARSNSSMGQRTASEMISARIRELQDWRGETLALVRRLICEAEPAMLEEWKWDTPVWSRDGIVCTGEIYKQTVKLTFAKGAFLADPQHLFNAGLTGNVRRAIDLRAGDEVEGASFRELIREAVAYNREHPPKGRRSSEPR